MERKDSTGHTDGFYQYRDNVIINKKLYYICVPMGQCLDSRYTHGLHAMLLYGELHND